MSPELLQCNSSRRTHALPDLPATAVAVLLEEAELTPKPALVDRRGSGAHHDLDLTRLRRSALSLYDGFAAIARTAAGQPPSLRLREQLGQIGRAMERRMMLATTGSNAHRGTIWSLGLLVAAAAQQPGPHTATGLATRAAVLARLPDRLSPRRCSHGEQARWRFGVAGARGEAQAAFPHVIHVGLPALRQARAQRAPECCARLDALLAIMACLDDTCLLHRGGPTALAAAKVGACAVLAAGGTASAAGRWHLRRLDAELMRQWASPGGSADLLSATLLLDRLEDSSWKH